MAITYSLARAGTQLGQFTLEQIRDGLKSGQFAWTDNYWKAGMATWGSLSSLAGEIQAINHAVSPAASSAPTGAAHVSPASASPVAAASPKLASEADGPPRCNAVVYAILGVALGMIGMHNFYIGRPGRAWIQIFLTLSVAGLLFNIPWVLCEVAQVREDASGRRFSGA